MADKPFLPEILYLTANKVITILNANLIPFRIIGGIAVSHHARPRMTQDLDFLIDPKDEDRVQQLFPDNHPLSMENTRGFTTVIDGIDLDFIISNHPVHLSEPSGNYFGLPVAGKKGIIYLKLQAGRSKDLQDIIEIAKHSTASELKEIQDFISINGNEEMQESLDYATEIALLEKKQEEKPGNQARMLFWKMLKLSQKK